jgi:hypothetical protein
VIVRLEHLSGVRGFNARPGLCRKGARAWFARYQLDWDAFRKHGIDADTLLATGDAFAIAVVEHVRTQEATRGR